MIKKILAGLLALLTAAVAFATEVNTATPAELDAVKGIGPVLSARIVDARKAGPFKDWGDFVTRVKGVGDKNGAEFSAGGLTVNGSAKAGAPVDATATRKAGKATTQPAAKAGTTGTTPPVATTSPAAMPAPATAATTPTAATAPVAGAASAPMSAADKKAARKAAKEEAKAEKARMKATNSATGAASAASTAARK